jgi:protein-tyrosine phosphatase
MHPQIFLLDHIGQGLLSIMPCPRGGDWLDGEIQFFANTSVNVLVSLLTADEVAELELQDEERLCGDCGLRFISFPIPDRGVPLSTAEAGRIIDLILDELWAGKAVAVHCRIGIGRSSL